MWTKSTKSNTPSTLAEQALAKAEEAQKALEYEYGKASKSKLVYPLTLDAQIEKGRECMRFRIISRDHLSKKEIYFLTPAGLSVPDGVSYNELSLGSLGGKAVEAGSAVIDNIKKGKFQKTDYEEILGMGDMVAAATIAAYQYKGGVHGEKGTMAAGLAANPYTNNAFQGSNMRTFEFNFKLIAESMDEAKEARNIENTFRKFLYPRKHPGSPMVLIYPPYWEITFWKKDGKNLVQNEYLPLIMLCNLETMNTTYNASGNAFHEDGSPTEVDMSLSFKESITLTREDLYGETAIDYDAVEYKWDNIRSGQNTVPQSTPEFSKSAKETGSSSGGGSRYGGFGRG